MMFYLATVLASLTTADNIHTHRQWHAQNYHP